MKEIKIGRITLSFIFISIGIIMLLRKLTDYGTINLISVFWPIIIVFFGLELIYSYFYMQSNDIKKGHIDILSISTISILVILLGLNNIPKEDNKYKYSDSISEEIVLKNNKKIIIDDSNVDVFVKQSDDKMIKIKLEGVYKHNTKENDQKKRIFIKQENQGSSTKISRHNDRKIKNEKNISSRDMKYLISLPNGSELEVASKYGDIDIEDIRSNININNSYGDLRLSNITGDINIENSYGEIFGKDIDGKIIIKSNNGDILLETEKTRNKNVDIFCDYGNLTIKLPFDQMGKFNIMTSYGNIYDELEFNIIESASTSNINQIRQRTQPNFNIRVNNGDIMLKNK